MNIRGKNILITGSNRGIGLALARQASIEKMKIHLLNRSENKEVIEELVDLGASEVQAWHIDMSDPKSIENFFKLFSSSDYSCDVLINNAGQLTGGLLENQPLEKIYSMLQVNLVGLIHLTKLLLPGMLEQPEAKIVNNASVSGIMHLPCASTYSASKAGVVAFTESLKNELSGSSVSTLLMVTPGVKTRMYDEIDGLYSEHLDLSALSSIPADQWAQRVFDCIKRDKTVCWPKGRSYLGVKLGQHLPGTLARLVDSYFER